MQNNTILIRSTDDFPTKLIEIKSIYPSKELAILAIREHISKLLKIRQFRYYLEDDLQTLRSISVYRGFEILLNQEEDWILPEPKKFNLIQSIKSILQRFLGNSKSQEKSSNSIQVISKKDQDILRLMAKKKALKEDIDRGNINSLEIEAARSAQEEKIRRKAINERLLADAKRKAQEESILRVYEEARSNETVQLDEPEIIEILDPTELITKSLWKLDGNTEDSLGDLHGIVVKSNGLSYIQSTTIFGKDDTDVLYFQSDGINFISLPEDSLSFRDDFSIRFKLYVPSSVGTSGITILSTFDNKLKYDDYYGWYVNYSNNTINVGMGMTYSDSPNFTFSEMSIKDQWVDIIITRRRSTRTTIYVNGIKSADSYIINDPIYSTNNLAYIGASYYSLAMPSYTANNEGFKISSIETWNGYELLQDDIDDLYYINKSNSIFKNIFK